MAVYGTMVLTQKGQALFAKAQAGTQLNFTRMQIGSGQLAAGQDPTALTALINPIGYFAVNSISANGNIATIRGIFTNSAITSSKYTCEIGLFAQDPSVGEILYAYATAGTQGDTIPPISSGPLSKQFTISVAIGNATSVTATVPTDTYIPVTDKGAAGGVAPLDSSSKVPAANLPLNSSTSSTSTTQAATPSAIKTAYDLAGAAGVTAAAAKSTADAAAAKTITLADSIDLNSVITSGFYRLSTSPSNGPSGAVLNYGQLIVSRGMDTIFQIVTGFDNNEFYVRHGNQIGGTANYQPWHRLWHDGNITPLSKAGDVMTGNLKTTPSTGTIASKAGASGTLEVISNGGANDGAFYSFHRPGVYATNFGIDADNVLKIGGWSDGGVSYKIWSEKYLRQNANGFLEFLTSGGTWRPVGSVWSTKAGGSFSTDSASTVTALSLTGAGRLRTLTFSGGAATYDEWEGAGWQYYPAYIQVIADGVTVVSASLSGGSVYVTPQLGIASIPANGGFFETDINFTSSLVVRISANGSNHHVTSNCYWVYEQ